MEHSVDHASYSYRVITTPQNHRRIDPQSVSVNSSTRIDQFLCGPKPHPKPKTHEVPMMDHQTFWIGFGGFCGMCYGSFMHVVYSRGLAMYKELQNQQSITQWLSNRSRCPHCQTLIKSYDNIPILSWCWLKAKCRTCKTPIPVSYWWFEWIGLLAGLGLGWWINSESLMYVFYVPLIVLWVIETALKGWLKITTTKK